MTALKFTDRDVRERPELVAEAIRYLRWYQGEFEFLVDAKRYEFMNGNLPLATARGVLNCMRVDVRYALVADGLPEPAPYSVPEERPKRKLRAVKDDTRWPFYLKTYWNARYYYSTHKSAQVVHVIRPDAQLKYYPEAQDVERRYWPWADLRSFCSASLSHNTVRLSRVMPEGKRFCHRCAELIEEFGYDWGPTAPPPSLGDNVNALG